MRGVIIQMAGGTGNQLLNWHFSKHLERSNGVRCLYDIVFYSRQYDTRIDKRKFELGWLDDRVLKIEALPKSVQIYWMYSGFRRIFRMAISCVTRYTDFYVPIRSTWPPIIRSILFVIFRNIYYVGLWKAAAFDGYLAVTINQAYSLNRRKDLLRFQLYKTKLDQSIGVKVAVGVRRGDFVKIGAATPIHWYRNEMERICRCVDKVILFVIFSDDIEFCEQQFSKLPYRFLFVAPNQRHTPIDDLELMSECDYFIIGNSTFHALGAISANRNEPPVVIGGAEGFIEKYVKRLT